MGEHSNGGNVKFLECTSGNGHSCWCSQIKLVLTAWLWHLIITLVFWFHQWFPYQANALWWLPLYEPLLLVRFGTITFNLSNLLFLNCFYFEKKKTNLNLVLCLIVNQGTSNKLSTTAASSSSASPCLALQGLDLLPTLISEKVSAYRSQGWGCFHYWEKISHAYHFDLKPKPLSCCTCLQPGLQRPQCFWCGSRRGRHRNVGHWECRNALCVHVCGCIGMYIGVHARCWAACPVVLCVSTLFWVSQRSEERTSGGSKKP